MTIVRLMETIGLFFLFAPVEVGILRIYKKRTSVSSLAQSTQADTIVKL